jgi:hypothetical protein
MNGAVVDNGQYPARHSLYNINDCCARPKGPQLDFGANLVLLLFDLELASRVLHDLELVIDSVHGKAWGKEDTVSLSRSYPAQWLCRAHLLIHVQRRLLYSKLSWPGKSYHTHFKESGCRSTLSVNKDTRPPPRYARSL